MRFDILYLWFLGDPQAPRCVGTLRLVDGGKGVSLQYGSDWIGSGFALSEDLPLSDLEHRPRDRLVAGTHVAVGAVDDARPDRWGERVIQYIDRPKRLSLMEYLYFAGDDRFGALGVSNDDPRGESGHPGRRNTGPHAGQCTARGCRSALRPQGRQAHPQHLSRHCTACGRCRRAGA